MDYWLKWDPTGAKREAWQRHYGKPMTEFYCLIAPDTDPFSFACGFGLAVDTAEIREPSLKAPGELQQTGLAASKSNKEVPTEQSPPAVANSEADKEQIPPPRAREGNISAPQSSSRPERHRWAVCLRPTDGTSFPERFLLKGDAVKWQYEIVHPATINVEEELPPDPAAGREAGRIVRKAVPIRSVPRRDSCGYDWTILERVDGKPIQHGVGAFRDLGGTGGTGGVSNIGPDELPPGYHPEVRRYDQGGWCYLVPINWLDEQQGRLYSGPRFREFLPQDRISTVQTTDLRADIDEFLKDSLHRYRVISGMTGCLIGSRLQRTTSGGMPSAGQ